jgi:uncharacterized protein
MNWNDECLSMRYIVFVKFNASGKILINGNEITIFLRSEPKKGKANRELIDRLAEHFATSKNRVHIISGLTSSKKIIEMQETN